MKLHWLIDQLIGSYIDWALNEPPWDGTGGLTSGLIQYMNRFNIHFVFPSCAKLWGTERTKRNRSTHESITAVIQWLYVNLKQVCHCLWGTGLTGFMWGFEVQHCHLRTGLDAAGSRRITSSYRGHWCFSKMQSQTKKQGVGLLGCLLDKLRRFI